MPPRPKKNKRTHRHPYKTYLAELRPAWKQRPESIKSMIQDMIERKERYLLGRPALMEFVERFMDIHEKKIRRVKPALFDEIRWWARVQRIEYYADVAIWTRKVDYEHKYWVNETFQLDFLEREIAKTRKLLRFRHKDHVHSYTRVEIYEIFREGGFPDPAHYVPELIGQVLALIRYTEMLTAERNKLLQSTRPVNMTVPVEIKTDGHTQQEYVQVQIPSGFFSHWQQKAIQKELDAMELTMHQPDPEPNLLTRDQLAKRLGISLPKLDELTREGTIQCYRIPGTNMKRYRWQEVITALEQVEGGKFGGRKATRATGKGQSAGKTKSM